MSNTVLLTSIVEKTSEEVGMRVVQFSPHGDPHATAVVAAVLADYSEVTGRPIVTDAGLRELHGSKVTLLRTGENMFGATSVQAAEGTIFVTGRDVLAYLPKGKRTSGFRLSAEQVLDVEVGYNKTDVLRQRIEQVKARYPVVEELTQEHLLALPEEAPSPAQIGLVVFGTWRGPAGNSPGAVWCLHSYIPEDDIVEGYLIVRPEDGDSEHGSIYGRQLLQFGGRVVNPPALSFAECFDLGALPYAEALARFAPAAVRA